MDVRRWVLGGCLTACAVAGAAAGVSGCEAVAGVRDVRLADDATVEGGAETGPDDTLPSSETMPAETSAPETETAAPCATGFLGASMIAVTGPSGTFCIDRTETTGPQYKLFVDAPSKPAAPARCGGSTATAPSKGYAPATLPQGELTWCAAAQYCAWAGKRLCTRAEWTFTCTQGGKTVFPYGDAYSAGKCVDGVASAAPVGSATDCHGATAPYSEVYDLSGNIDEWIDDCDDTATPATCKVMGGYYGDPSTAKYLACNEPFTHPIDVVDAIGIRCCADPT